MIAVLCAAASVPRGSYAALSTVIDPHDTVAIVNTGDDTTLHGLSISPDIDTVIYTLAEAIDPERGWGLADESWRAMEQPGQVRVREACRIECRCDLVQPR